MRSGRDQSNNGKIGVFIADSYPVFRHGLASHLNLTPDMESVGQAGTGQELLDGFQRAQASVLLLDAGLMGLDGFVLLRQFKSGYPALPVLLMSTSQDVRWLLRGIRAGANGVVAREASLEEVETAIRRVHGGHPYIPELLSEQLVLFYQRQESDPLDARLSPRELEVMQWLTRGFKLSEIARALSVSHQTVTTHRRHILEKTGLRTTAEIIRYGIMNGVEECCAPVASSGPPSRRGGA
jgi:DNA-binding NarL/FixJ family response regulator